MNNLTIEQYTLIALAVSALLIAVVSNWRGDEEP